MRKLRIWNFVDFFYCFFLGRLWRSSVWRSGPLYKAIASFVLLFGVVEWPFPETSPGNDVRCCIALFFVTYSFPFLFISYHKLPPSPLLLHTLVWGELNTLSKHVLTGNKCPSKFYSLAILRWESLASSYAFVYASLPHIAITCSVGCGC